MQAVPVRARIGAVHRVGVVEAIVAAGDELRMEIGDVAVGVGVDRVVGGVGLELHHRDVGAIVARPGQPVGLPQRRDRVEHHRLAQPAAIPRAPDDRTVTGPVHGEAPRRGAAVRRAVGQRDVRHAHRAPRVAVAVEQAAVPPDDGLQEPIDGIRVAGGVHPAQPVVEALVEEELAPGRGPVGVEPRVAGHLQLRAEIEGGVRIDQQERVVIPGVRRRDGDAVRSRRLADEVPRMVVGPRGSRCAVETCQNG